MKIIVFYIFINGIYFIKKCIFLVINVIIYRRFLFVELNKSDNVIVDRMKTDILQIYLRWPTPDKRQGVSCVLYIINSVFSVSVCIFIIYLFYRWYSFKWYENEQVNFKKKRYSFTSYLRCH